MRLLIIVLVAANIAMWAAVRGSFGGAPAAGERAPWRLTEQIRADTLSVRILPPVARRRRGKRLQEDLNKNQNEDQADCGKRCGAYL